jgi:hypothetical protein
MPFVMILTYVPFFTEYLRFNTSKSPSSANSIVSIKWSISYWTLITTSALDGDYWPVSHTGRLTSRGKKRNSCLCRESYPDRPVSDLFTLLTQLTQLRIIIIIMLQLHPSNYPSIPTYYRPICVSVHAPCQVPAHLFDNLERGSSVQLRAIKQSNFSLCCKSAHVPDRVAGKQSTCAGS